MKAMPTGYDFVSGTFKDNSIINLDTFEVNDIQAGAGQVTMFESPTDQYIPIPASYQAAFDPANKETFTPSGGGSQSVTPQLTRTNYGGRAESTLTQPLIFGTPVTNKVDAKVSPIWYVLAGIGIYFYFFKKRRK